MAKVLQLLRNKTSIYESFAAAKAQLSNDTFVSARKDGEAVLARYTDGSVIKTALGLYHVGVNDKMGVTVLQDSATVQNLIDALQTELDTTQSSTGLAADGSYVADSTSGSIIGSATSVLDATKILAAAVSKEVADRKSAISALDDEDAEVEGSVVVDVVQTDGVVKKSNKKQAQALKLTGFSSTGETGSLQIAATDTIGGALNKIETYFKGLDVAEVYTSGQAIVKVSQTNGKIAATAGDIAAAHVTVADASGIITATNVEGALTEIAKNIAANEVVNADGSITVTPSSSTTDVKVHIKSGEGVIKLSATDGLYTDLDLVKVTTGLASNVKVKYQLLDSANNQIGADIEIPKDSALDKFYLGHVDDKLTNADAEGESSDDAVTDGTGDTALVYVMQLANGKYKLTAVNVQTFLEESEFADGLSVTNHVVKVKKDTASETVITEYNANGTAKTNSDVITVSTSGVKVANIQKAITAAIGTLDVTDSAVSGKYVSAVSETDGKIAVSRVNVSASPLNSYSKGSSSAAVAATDTINSAIGKLENQVSAAKAAAKTVVNTTVSGESASHMTITKDSTAADGHDAYSFSLTDVASQDALEAEVTRAEAAEKTLASSIGCAYSDTTKVVTAYASTSGNTYANKNVVKSDIAALDAEVKNALNTVTGSDAITVSTKASKNQTISLKLSSATDNALTISSGLYLSNVWDCGTY